MQQGDDLREHFVTAEDARSQPGGLHRVLSFDRDGGELDVYRRGLLLLSFPLEEVGEEGLVSPAAAPLRSTSRSSYGGPLPSPGSSSSRGGADNFAVTTITLANVILGAGILVRECSFC